MYIIIFNFHTLSLSLPLKPDRNVKVGLSITETDLVVVEDLTSLTSNAVVMKGTVVLNFHSPPTIKGTANHTLCICTCNMYIVHIHVLCGC